MSSYENYNETSAFYDVGRQPVGKDLILRVLKETAAKRCNGDLSRLKILDAGCGTGNYLTWLFDLGCRELTGLEHNDGMLEQCSAKVARHAGMKRHVRLVQGSVLELPFPRGEFDILFANQMVHHVDTDDTRDNKDNCNIKTAIGEFNRVLGKGGVAMINESRVRQQEHAYWYYRFIMRANERCRARLLKMVPDTEWFQDNMNERGFRVAVHDVGDNFIRPKSFLNDPQNVKDPKWRALDSMWAPLTESDLQRVYRMVDEASSDAVGWKKFMEEIDLAIDTYGKSVYYVGYKMAEAKEAGKLMSKL